MVVGVSARANSRLYLTYVFFFLTSAHAYVKPCTTVHTPYVYIYCVTYRTGVQHHTYILGLMVQFDQDAGVVWNIIGCPRSLCRGAVSVPGHMPVS